MRELIGVAVLALFGLGAVWAGKHLPLPHQEKSAAEVAREATLDPQVWGGRANKICGRIDRRLRADARRLRRASSREQALRRLTAIQADFVSGFLELQALPVPPTVERRVDRLFRLYRLELGLYDRLTQAFRAGDRAKYLAILKRIERGSARHRGLALRLGAPYCA